VFLYGTKTFQVHVQRRLFSVSTSKSQAEYIIVQKSDLVLVGVYAPVAVDSAWICLPAVGRVSQRSRFTEQRPTAGWKHIASRVFYHDKLTPENRRCLRSSSHLRSTACSSRLHLTGTMRDFSFRSISISKSSLKPRYLRQAGYAFICVC